MSDPYSDDASLSNVSTLSYMENNTVVMAPHQATRTFVTVPRRLITTVKGEKTEAKIKAAKEASEMFKNFKKKINDSIGMHVRHYVLEKAKEEKIKHGAKFNNDGSLMEEGEVVSRFDDIAQSWKEDNSHDNAKWVWMALFGQFDLMPNWQEEVEALVMRENGWKYDDNDKPKTFKINGGKVKVACVMNVRWNPCCLMLIQ